MPLDTVRDHQYAFLGAGIIAGVFIERLIKLGVPPGSIIASDVRPERLEEIKTQFGIQVTQGNSHAASRGQITFLAVPPNVVKPLLEEVAQKLPGDALVVSLAAAIPTWLMEKALARPLPVLRMIPNTPSLIGRGMNPHCLGKYVRDEQQPLIAALLGAFGETIRVDEGLMEAATALTAVGPTYVFPVIKAMKDAAVRLGLSEDQAQFAAAQTVAGAAQLVIETGKEPDVLKLMIGTRTLNEDEARALFTAALESAHEKVSGAQKKLAQAG